MILILGPKNSWLWSILYRVVDAEIKVKCVENKCTNIYDAVAVVEMYEALYEGKQEGRKSHVPAVEASASNT